MASPAPAPPEGGGAAEDVSGDGGVIKAVVRPGAGATPPAGSRLSVRYTGSLQSGVVFDRCDAAAPFTFVLGKGQVIRGWDLALATMRVGEVAQLEVRHDHGYGESGLPPKIPAHALLLFEIELLAVDDANAAAEPEPAGALAIADAPAGGGGGEGGQQPHTLVVGGDPVQLDSLGPIVVNTDGSLSRITNWAEMTEAEQKKTLRVVAKRNKARLRKQ